MAQWESQQFHMRSALKYALDCTQEKPMRSASQRSTANYAAGRSTGRIVIHVYLLAIAFMLIIPRTRVKSLGIYSIAPLVES